MTHLVSYQSAPLFSSSMDEDDESGSQTPVLSFYESHIAASITHVYISKPIVEPAAYIPLIQYLNTRTPNDEVHIHFNCPGGRVDTGIQLITATRNCQARVIGHLDSMAYSMAAIWFLSCDSHYVSEHGTLMFHVYSGGGGGGKAPDQRAAQEAVDRTFMGLITDICVPFLTKREVADLDTNSRDLYFHYDDIVNRLEGNHLKKAKPAKKKTVKAKPAKSESPISDLPVTDSVPVEMDAGEAVVLLEE